MAAKSEGITTDQQQSKLAWQHAEVAHALGDIDQAIELYQQALGGLSTPSDKLSCAINLGALLRVQGQLSKAASHYRNWLSILPQTPTLSLNACNCLRELGNVREALVVVEDCMKANPHEDTLIIGKAECLLDLGQMVQSRTLLEELLKRNPNLQRGWMVLGVVLARQQQIEAALQAFTRADELGSDQGHMAANRINMLKDLRRMDEAQALWCELPSEKKESAAVRGALAGLRLAQNQPEEASLLLAVLCGEAPQETSHWLNWSACLRSLKYTVAPTAVLKRAILHHPDDWDLHEALGQSLAEMGNLSAYNRLLQRQPKRDDETWKDVHVFNRQFLGITTDIYTGAEKARQVRDWEARKAIAGMCRLWADHMLEPLEGRVLRVGYLTADACNHPVGRFLLPILKHHDRSQVETWMLSCGSHHDWISDQLRQASQHWQDLQALNDQQAARLVADMRLDVIVELGGFTGGSRIGILAHRPAPIQLSYLGYPAPTYMGSIDGWIGDAILFGGLTKTDKGAHKLHEITGGYMAFDPGTGIKPSTRKDKGGLRFGCFNHARKLSDSTIELFVSVMNAVPEAELAIKSISFHEEAEQSRIRKRFENAGLSPNRLLMLDWVEGGLNHLSRYGSIDIALDPIPYGGATTTCEALWMGVPVVTLAGQGMAGRLSASLLHHAGCTDWIARDRAEYVTIAANLAKEGPRSDHRRVTLRQKIETSMLFNPRRLSQELEYCYLRERTKLETLQGGL